jgi:hypothetical protein
MVTAGELTATWPGAGERFNFRTGQVASLKRKQNSIVYLTWLKGGSFFNPPPIPHK